VRNGNVKGKRNEKEGGNRKRRTGTGVRGKE